MIRLSDECTHHSIICNDMSTLGALLSLLVLIQHYIHLVNTFVLFAYRSNFWFKDDSTIIMICRALFVDTLQQTIDYVRI